MVRNRYILLGGVALGAIVGYLLWFRPSPAQVRTASSKQQGVPPQEVDDFSSSSPRRSITTESNPARRELARSRPQIAATAGNSQTLTTVHGTVTDAQTGQPVHGAEIFFDSGTVSSSASDASGKYQILLPPNTYDVTAVGEQVVGSAGMVTIQASVESQVVNVKVGRAAVVRGEVVDKVGTPIEGASIKVVGKRRKSRDTKAISRMMEFGIQPSQNTTDDEGKFAVAVPAERRLIVAAKTSNGVEVQSWVPVLKAGQEERVRLIVDSTAEVTGHVWSANGAPAAGVKVYAIYNGLDGEQSIKKTDTDRAGAYVFRDVVPTQKLHIQASIEDVGQSPPKVFAIASNENKVVDLQLMEPAVIAGRVVDDVGDAVPGIEVYVKGHNSAIFISKNTDSDGNFRFDGLAIGPYKVVARSEQHHRTELSAVESNQTSLIIQMSRKSLSNSELGNQAE